MAFDAHLALKLHPVEGQCRPLCFGQLAAFAAVVIAEKHKTVRVETFQQHDARRRSPVGTDRGQIHCRRLWQLRLQGVVHPFAKLREGIGRKVALAQRGKLVVFAEVGERIICAHAPYHTSFIAVLL